VPEILDPGAYKKNCVIVRIKNQWDGIWKNYHFCSTASSWRAGDVKSKRGGLSPPPVSGRVARGNALEKKNGGSGGTGEF